MAVVAEGPNGRLYITPDAEQVNTAKVDVPEGAPISDLPEKALSFRVQVYGMKQHKDLFTNRHILGPISSLISTL